MSDQTPGDRVIGFIGLGNMGWNMASHLAKSGYEVLGFDANLERTKAFAAERGTEPPELADLARASVIWTMLPTGDVVRDVLAPSEGEGLLAALSPGTLHIDTTSSPPWLTKELGEIEQKHGVALVDCGVSGGHRGAIEGDLVFMLGGDDQDAVRRAQVLLAVMSSKIVVLGALGRGHAMKSINNAVSAACFAATCEGLILGQKLGLELETMLDILSVSTGQNDAASRSVPKIIDGSFRKTFSLGLFTKDVKIARDLAESASVEAPIAGLVYDRMASAIAEYGGDVDHTYAYKSWASQNGGDAPV
ncbi:NAD(P)-dependent oxidoreductase [Amycolatopsis sp. GM8]|uniref:NAD(P)-dependent oxidoreductase n=1 Tax=Amycolatopsis sp. GM8 TaxID=2896530 RepID=UPI001F40A5C5|nr:NAD(P)-dependent oxidoreductase [Amycolatopsis sp. GM8]